MSGLLRPAAKATVNIIVGVSAVMLALAIGAIFISLAGASPVEAYEAVWAGAFGSRPQIANTLQKTIPLLLVSLGWIVAFTAKRINIGLEGQVILGALGATAVGVNLDLPMVAALPISMAAGSAAGTAWCGIAAWLWARRGVNEIISTLMLNLIAVQVSAWMLRGPLAGSSGDVVRSEAVADGARWPILLERTPLTWAITLIPVSVVLVWFVLHHTVFGYRLTFVGSNESAARVGGISDVRVSVVALLWSGALAGTAGAVLVLASQGGALTDNISGGLGFTGIVAALLAGGSALGSVAASLLLAALSQGGGLMESRTGVSADVTGVVQGMVILLVAGTVTLTPAGVRRLSGLGLRDSGGGGAGRTEPPPGRPDDADRSEDPMTAGPDQRLVRADVETRLD